MAQTAMGFLLKALREERKLSLREAAQLSGVDHSYINRLETGVKESPSEEVLSKLIRSLKAGERERKMLHYLAAYTQTDTELVALTLNDPTVDYEIFAAVAGAAFRGPIRTDYDKLIGRIRRILAEDDNMNEFTVVLKARKFVDQVNPDTAPVSIESYVEHIGAILRHQKELKPDESGWSFKIKDKHYICVNANDSYQRQRFTVCHEIAHHVLNLPSNHKGNSLWSYKNKSQNEIFCDIFASELLLPYKLFKQEVNKADVTLMAVDELAKHFAASTIATGSRFAALSDEPCAFILAERGILRYISRSTALRESHVWISPRQPLPKGSIAEYIRAGTVCDIPGEVDADVWLDDWDRGGILIENSRHRSKWDQTITLLCFEEEVPPIAMNWKEREEELVGLEELDGALSWPSKRRRR